MAATEVVELWRAMCVLGPLSLHAGALALCCDISASRGAVAAGPGQLEPARKGASGEYFRCGKRRGEKSTVEQKKEGTQKSVC